MPGLKEEMYCSQQIAIPPPFPYLLGQYAKAAIRSQPTDLLKWSTTYFRCLSLNLPPPVKKRLEYPPPRDWFGVTPGWLKTLMYQLQTNKIVPFRLLWDRWIGACLEHTSLVQLLCLGGFSEPGAIPLLRFIAIAASTLTESLTETMILICEILTEEPEGGSAMITVDVFIDLYKFLAAIEASEPQVLLNTNFTDSLLGLWKEKQEAFEEAKDIEKESTVEEASSASTISERKEDEEKGEQLGVEISCPSIGDDDYKKIEDYLLEQEMGGEYEGEGYDGRYSIATQETTAEEKKRQEDLLTEERQREYDKTDREKAAEEADEGSDEDLDQLLKETEDMAGDEALGGAEMKKPPNFEEPGILEDLEKLKALQSELAGEVSGPELEEFAGDMLPIVPPSKTPSEIEAISHFTKDITTLEEKMKKEREEEAVEPQVSEESEEKLPSLAKAESEEKFEEIYIDAIPGLGGVVPQEVVAAVISFMQDMATIQHGMVMPRNIRHYTCPPLEIFDKTKI